MRQVTELMKYLEEALLDEVGEKQISEQLTEQENKESMSEVQRSRIKERVWQQIGGLDQKETPRESSSPLKNKPLAIKHKTKLYKKVFLLAGVMLVLCGGAVGAISVSETLQALFGNNVGLIASDAQRIQKSISAHGVSVTLDTAVVDNTGGVIIFNFIKENGGCFEENTTLRQATTEFSKPTTNWRNQEYILSEDKKQLTYILSLGASEGVTKGELITKFSDLVVATPTQVTTDMNLEKIHGQMGVELTGEEALPDENGAVKIIRANEYAKAPINIPFNHPYIEASLVGVGFRGADFFVEVECKPQEEYLGEFYKLIDSRTGESYGYNSEEFYNKGEEGEPDEREVRKSFYQGIKADDLAYIQVVNVYDTYKYIVEGDWVLTYELMQNQNIKQHAQRKRIETDTEVIIVDYVEISFIGGVIEGRVVDKSEKNHSRLPDSKLLINVVMADGTKIPYVHNMSSKEGDGFRMVIQPEVIFKEEQNTAVNQIQQRVIDVSQVKGIEIEGEYIRLK